MDAYSMSCTNLAMRDSSRIYQDLKASRLHSLILGQNHLLSRPSTDGHGPSTNGSPSASGSGSASNKPGMTRDPARQPHVAVIGAGVSGLRCVDVLLQHDFRVSLFEGRDRIGGRLHQQHLIPFPSATSVSNNNNNNNNNDNGERLGPLVDMGPNWLHGTDDNPVLDLARQTGTPVGAWDTKAFIYSEHGTLFSEAEGEQYATVMWDIIQDAFEHSNKSGAEIDPGVSLLDFFHERVKERIPDAEEGFERRREIVLRMAESWGTFVGSPIARQSLKFFWLEECIEGENLFCAGTHKKILEAMAKPALDGADVHFNCVAEKIVSRTAAEDGQGQGQVKVQFRGGQTLAFDEVVVTAPLGWLKRNLAAFEPPLPSRLVQAIGSIGYGCLEKVYISFPKAFWLATETGTTETTESEKASTESRESREGKSVGGGIRGFVHWLAPAYASSAESNPKRWLQEIVELATIAPEAAHPTLLFYLYGEQSEHITSHLASLDAEAEADAEADADDKQTHLSKERKKHAFLTDWFRPYYSLLPNYSPASADCRPSSSLATGWLRDELAGHGSYSNFQVGLAAGDEDVRAMRAGWPEGGVWLAGEHTAPYVALGTVTGAYWSGESVGRRIAEGYGRG